MIITLKEGREKALLNRHPWVFSGAVARMPRNAENGDVVYVRAANGQFLAKAFFHSTNSIVARVITFLDEPPQDAILRCISEAIALRLNLFNLGQTSAYRLINAEGDGLSGLIVDYYNGVLVIQISTCGMEKQRDFIVDVLKRLLKPRAIYEKSTAAARIQDGLEERCGWVLGLEKTVEIKENGVSFIVQIEEGQKTGFFLDQREMRHLVRNFAKNRKVLNCFSYTGGFSICALLGGAIHVDSVDSCQRSLALIDDNLALNHLPKDKHTQILSDAFDFVEQSDMQYDLVILDPPALIKKKADIDKGARAYKELNRKAMQKMKEGSLLLTSSCSYFINESMFDEILFRAAVEANKNVKIVGRHIQALDHPQSIFHPEGKYLKSLFLKL